MLAQNLLTFNGPVSLNQNLTNKTMSEQTKPFVGFDLKACAKKLDEVGTLWIAYKGRPGYDIDGALKSIVYPLDKRLNVDNERTEALQKAILALPSVPPKGPEDTFKAPAPTPALAAKK